MTKSKYPNIKNIKAKDLKDLGYRVEVIRYDDDWKGKVVAKIGDIY